MTPAEAKIVQGYEAKPVLHVCGTCEYFNSEWKFPLWIQADAMMTEFNKRCGRGNFTVKKTATCSLWTQKEEL